MKLRLTEKALKNLYPTKRRGHAKLARRTWAPLLGVELVEREPVDVASVAAATSAVKAELCEPVDDETARAVSSALANEKKSLDSKLKVSRSEFEARKNDGMADDEVDRREREMKSLEGYLAAIASAEKRLGRVKPKSEEAKS